MSLFILLFFFFSSKYFGTAQGKSWTDIKLLADAAGVELINFVPPEAETVEDIRSRCISFFDVSKYFREHIKNLFGNL